MYHGRSSQPGHYKRTAHGTVHVLAGTTFRDPTPGLTAHGTRPQFRSARSLDMQASRVIPHRSYLPLRLGRFPSPLHSSPRACPVGREWFSRESSRCPPRRPRPTAAYSCRLRRRRPRRVCPPCGPSPAAQRTPWRPLLWTRPRSLRAPQRSQPWASGRSCRKGTIR
jgi:hypothetical protein